MSQSKTQSHDHSSTSERWSLPELAEEWDNHPGSHEKARDLRYSALYHNWYDRVGSGNPNDYVIAITADPRTTGVSGTGKTTLGAGLAENWFDHSQGGFDAETQYTLDPSVLAYEMYNETGELACLIHDEGQGTPASTGLNAKRAMKGESLDAVNAIAAGRSDRKTIILILQDLKFLTKDAITYIDSWLLIRNEHDYVATHYAVSPDVFDFGSREIKTPGIEQITWDALASDNSNYQVMEQKKEDAKQGKGEFSDDTEEDEITEIPKDLRDAKIRDLATAGIEQKKIAEAFDLSQSTVSRIANNQ
jgi:predicted XRE-type DNA-binding protein